MIVDKKQEIKKLIQETDNLKKQEELKDALE